MLHFAKNSFAGGKSVKWVPIVKKHENKKVDRKSVEFVCFVLNVTKIPHKIKTCSLVFYGKAYKIDTHKK